MSVHVPSDWQSGTLGRPREQTTTQVCPGNDSEQYPGKPGHVPAAEFRPIFAEIMASVNMMHFLAEKLLIVRAMVAFS